MYNKADAKSNQPIAKMTLPSRNSFRFGSREPLHRIKVPKRVSKASPVLWS
jgi:hypothetical protein